MIYLGFVNPRSLHTSKLSSGVESSCSSLIARQSPLDNSSMVLYTNLPFSLQGIGVMAATLFADTLKAVSYTHLTLPTNREV